MDHPAKLWKEGGVSYQVEEPTLMVTSATPTLSTHTNGGTSMKVKVTTPKGNENDVIMTARTFATGTRGFHGHGKIQEGDKKYQINFQMYEVGSKPDKAKK